MTERLQRLGRAWSGLNADQRFACLAAAALLVTMFLPWYEKSYAQGGKAVTDSISAFGAVSFVEAAIFLVSAGVFVLIFARGEGRAFHLPGGDGTIVFAAGVWVTLLIFYRVFDKPDVSGDGATVGIQWGFFIAFIMSGMLALAGHRMRVAHRPEPPLRDDDETAVTEFADPAPSSQPQRSERVGTPRTQAARAAAEAETEVVATTPEEDEPSDDTAETRVVTPRRRQAPPRDEAEQLAFEDPTHDVYAADEDEYFEHEDDTTLQPGEIPSARRRRRS